MMKLLTLLAFVVAVASAVDLDAEWAKFKETHNKQYAHPKEESHRRQIWMEHRDYIQAHNEAYERGQFSFYLGENEFADMPNEEFVSVMNGYQMKDLSERPAGRVVYQYDGDVNDLPDKVDWRQKGYVTDIKNQGQCGSCWAFSTTGSLEGQTAKKTGKLTSLSEQNLVDCSKKQGNHGCEGGLMDNGFTYIKENNGIDTEASYPYQGTDGECRFNASTVGANDTGFVDIKSKDESALQSAVATVGPISVAIDANHITFQLYSGGLYHNFFCSEENLDHGVLAVGYGAINGKDYWLVKNSWGKSWGLVGYIFMSRNRHNNCGIATQASYPTLI